jgi:hypothetical protein
LYRIPSHSPIITVLLSYIVKRSNKIHGIIREFLGHFVSKKQCCPTFKYAFNKLYTSETVWFIARKLIKQFLKKKA